MQGFLMGGGGGGRRQECFCAHKRRKPVRGWGPRYALFSLCYYAISCTLSIFVLYFARIRAI